MPNMFDGKSVSSVISLVSSAQDANSRRFGLCGRYPRWMQRFATPKSFLICFCLKNIFQGMIFTYLVGSETSIERHFQFDGQSIGLLLTLGEIGPILTAVVISHWGSRGNRPRWMAIGLLLIALALLLCYPMNLVFPARRLADYNVAGFLNGKEITASKAVCQQAPSSGQHPADGSLGGHLNASLLHQHDCTIDVVRRRWAFAAWVVIYSIMGESTAEGWQHPLLGGNRMWKTRRRSFRSTDSVASVSDTDIVWNRAQRKSGEKCSFSDANPTRKETSSGGIPLYLPSVSNFPVYSE
jgi:hypothetical protein